MGIWRTQTLVREPIGPKKPKSNDRDATYERHGRGWPRPDEENQPEHQHRKCRQFICCRKRGTDTSTPVENRSCSANGLSIRGLGLKSAENRTGGTVLVITFERPQIDPRHHSRGRSSRQVIVQGNGKRQQHGAEAASQRPHAFGPVVLADLFNASHGGKVEDRQKRQINQTKHDSGEIDRLICQCHARRKMHTLVDTRDHGREQRWFTAVVVLLVIRAQMTHFVDRLPWMNMATDGIHNFDLRIDRVCSVLDQGCNSAPTTAIIGTQECRLSITSSDNRDTSGSQRQTNQSKDHISGPSRSCLDCIRITHQLCSRGSAAALPATPSDVLERCSATLNVSRGPWVRATTSSASRPASRNWAPSRSARMQ